MTIKLLQLSDLHLLAHAEATLMGVNTEFYWHKTLSKALRQHPDADLLLLTGDLAQTPTPETYRRLLRHLADVAIPCLCLPGNHDNKRLMQEILNSGNVGCNKRQVFAHWQIINLDSTVDRAAGGHLSEQELNLIDLCIAQYPELWVFISIHHHCTATGSLWMDKMQIDNSNRLFERLQKHPQVKAITTGHIHQVRQQQKYGIKIFSAPSTCFQFKPLSKNFALDTLPPGYRWFRLQADGSLQTAVERLDIKRQGLDFSSDGY